MNSNWIPIISTSAVIINSWVIFLRSKTLNKEVTPIKKPKKIIENLFVRKWKYFSVVLIIISTAFLIL